MQQLHPQYAPLLAWGVDLDFVERFEQTWGGTRADLGRVVRTDAASCRVVTGGGELSASLARAIDGRPTTGDWVAVVDGRVEGVLERRSAIARSSFRDASEQVLAANVDIVVVVEALSSPLRPRRLERQLVLAWQAGAQPLVVLTKADTCDDPGDAVAKVMRLAPGSAVIPVSAPVGDGVDDLVAELAPGTTSVMIGRSGVGKSTLANVLAAGSGELATGDVRGDDKGRHTTVARELVRLAHGALLIDTPGLRAIGLVDDPAALAEVFADIEDLAVGCRFSDCAHGSEPGCAVQAAVAEGLIDQDRLEAYERLRRDQARLAARTDARLRAEQSAAERRFTRQVRGAPVRKR